MARAQETNRKDEAKDGRSTISTVVDKAGEAVSAVGSGAKKVASTVVENPMLAATGAAAIGAAVGGGCSPASANRRRRSRPRQREDRLRSDPRAPGHRRRRP